MSGKSNNISDNRRARFDYHIEEDLEVGVVLIGSEVKSLREGGANIADSYAEVADGELWLVNGYIPRYDRASSFSGFEERRRRKLLANRREIASLWAATQRKGMTLVPLSLYFNEAGRVKLKLGIAKGKNKSDKRSSSAARDWGREQQRLLKRSA
jgi:SsrA-binding protein